MFILQVKFNGVSPNSDAFFRRDILEAREGENPSAIFSNSYDSFGRLDKNKNILPWEGQNDSMVHIEWKRPNGPFDKYFPPGPPPTNQAKIKDLNRMSRVLDHILGEAELDGSVDPQKLEKASKVISKLIDKVTKGLDPGVNEKMKKELNEAIEAAKEEDFAKLEEFAEKIKNLKDDIVSEDQPPYILLKDQHYTPDKTPMSK